MKTALLVIDVQKSFSNDPARWASRNNPAFEANLTRLIDGFRSADQPVLFVLHGNAALPLFDQQGPHYAFQDFVQPQASEPTLHKTTRSVFTSTDLSRRLQQLGVQKLVISGIQTEQCCETTARDAGDLGFNVDFVTEATLTFPIKHWDGGPDLSAEEVTRRTEYALAGRFARIASVDQVLDDLKAQ